MGSSWRTHATSSRICFGETFSLSCSASMAFHSLGGEEPLDEGDGVGLLVAQVLGEPLAGRDEAHRQRRAGVLVGAGGEPGEPGGAGLEGGVDLGVLRPPSPGGRRGSASSARSSRAGQTNRSSVPWCSCSERENTPHRRSSAVQVRRSATGVACAAAANAVRSRRKAWCMAYISVMSTGPGGAAAWPGSRNCGVDGSARVIGAPRVGFGRSTVARGASTWGCSRLTRGC